MPNINNSPACKGHIPASQKQEFAGSRPGDGPDESDNMCLFSIFLCEESTFFSGCQCQNPFAGFQPLQPPVINGIPKMNTAIEP